MAEARGRSEWERVSLLCCVLVNSNPYRKKGAKPAKPADFNPYRAGRDMVMPISPGELRDFFPQGFGPQKE